MEKVHYFEDDDRLVIETLYDPTPVIEQNKALRNSGEREYFGSKGQRMLKVASITEEHIVTLRNMGYDLLSPDPLEVKRALLYVQAMENDWMCVDGKPIGEKNQKWA
jgi:hypothetical protein